jgi:hypothetical protein
MKKWIHQCWCACLVLSAARPGLAAEDSGWLDVAIKTGFSAGIAKQSKTNENGIVSSKSYNLGGIPVAAAFYRDVMPSLTATFQGQLLLDLVNQQMTRKGVEAGVAYHLIGGVRRLELGSKGRLHQVSRSKTSLSLAIREGLFLYEAINKQTSVKDLNGTTLETKGGLEYRRDLGENSALTFDLMSTLFAVRISVDRVEPVMAELLFGYRAFF